LDKETAVVAPGRPPFAPFVALDEEGGNVPVSAPGRDWHAPMMFREKERARENEREADDE
jgi:hypothetical protein